MARPLPFKRFAVALGICAFCAQRVGTTRVTSFAFEAESDNPTVSDLHEDDTPEDDPHSWYVTMKGLNCFEPNFEAMSHLDVLSSGVNPAKIDEASSSPTLLAAFKGTLRMNVLATSRNCRLCDMTLWGSDPGMPGGDDSWARTDVKCATKRLNETACFSYTDGEQMRRIKFLPQDDCRPCPAECEECHLSKNKRKKSNPPSFTCILPDKPSSVDNPVRHYQCTKAKSTCWFSSGCQFKTKCRFPEFASAMTSGPKDYISFWPAAEKHSQSLEFTSHYKLSNWSAYSPKERARLGALQGEMNDLLMGRWAGSSEGSNALESSSGGVSKTTLAPITGGNIPVPPPLPTTRAPITGGNIPVPPPLPTTRTPETGGKFTTTMLPAPTRGKGDLMAELLKGGKNGFNLKPTGSRGSTTQGGNGGTRDGGARGFLDELKGLSKDPKGNLKPVKETKGGKEQPTQGGVMGELIKRLGDRRSHIADEEETNSKSTCDAKMCAKMKEEDSCDWCPEEECCEVCC